MSDSPSLRDSAAQSARRVAVITGASSGIGRETALAYSRKGWAVVLAARRADRLEEIARNCRAAGGEALAVPTDVTRQEQVEALVARAMEAFGRLDVLVNNAGFGQGGRVHEITDRQMRDIFEVNFFGVFYGCKAALPVMMRQRSGHIFNVSSVIGKRGTPLNGAYCATKFAVAGMTESMRVELVPWKIRVTLVCPGLTDTEFFDMIREPSEPAGVEPSADAPGAPKRKPARVSFQRLRTMMPADAVARRIVRATGKNVSEMVFTLGGKALVAAAHRWPRFTDWLLGFYRDDLEKQERGLSQGSEAPHPE
jgi:NAD(P)-dependent dehydrogenase (short-subunit alcohol dehydrogenase family)